MGDGKQEARYGAFPLDEEESANKKIDDLNYLFEGKTMLNDVCRIIHLPPNTFDEVKEIIKDASGLTGKSFADCSKDDLMLAIESCVQIGREQFNLNLG
jgi:hypothetical protein